MPQGRHEHDHEFVWYPDNDVLAIIDDPAAANRAVQALHNAGYGPQDVHVGSGEEWVEKFAATGQPAGTLGRLVRFLQRVASDVTYENMRLYEEAARHGQAVVMVHLPGRDHLDEVADILRAHGARDINFFGPLAVERVV